MNWSDERLKEYSKEHVFYEVDLLLKTRKYYPIAARTGWIQKMTTIESFVIHLRCLINFLYPEAAQSQKDDVLANQFFSTEDEWDSIKPDIPPTLLEARKRANKEVGHLTQKRKSGSGKEKEWLVNELTDEMVVVLKKFCAFADNNKLHERISRLLNE